MQNENIRINDIVNAESENWRIRTSMPNDTSKRIDYVIKYIQKKEIDDDEKDHNIYREEFFNQLTKQNVEFYKNIRFEKEENTHVYTLLHCPMERLLIEADLIELEMPLKTEHLNKLKYDTEIELPFLSGVKNKLKTFNDSFLVDITNDVSTNFDISIQNLFRGFDEDKVDKKLFSTRTRCLLVDNILKNIDLSKAKKNSSHQSHHKDDDSDDEIEQGVGFMLHDNHFEDAFILHDETDYKIEMQRFLEKANLLFKDEVKIEDKSDIDNNKDKKIKDIRELTDIRTELHIRWASLKNMFKFQPINIVREYFGEEYALYFAWVGAIISTLWVPTVIGVIFFIAGISLSVKSHRNSNSTDNSTISLIFSESFDNDLTPYYALIICLWGAFFLEYWKRQNANLAYDWNVLKFESDETDLPEYTKKKATLKKELANANIYKKYFYSNEKQIKMAISFLILLLMICIVALDVAAVVLYRIQIKLKVYPNDKNFQLLIGDIGSTVLNAIFTISLNWIYDKIALITTKWECHRTRTQFKDNLTMKTFAFQFVNNYTSLFYLAFFRNIEHENGIFNLGSEYQDRCTNNNCMALLSTQIFVSLMIKPLPSFLTTVVIPVIYMTYKGILFKRMSNKIAVNKDIPRSENDELSKNEKHVSINLYIEKTKSDPNQTLSDEYTNKVIILGYIMLFACAFSLGPLIFLFINLFDLRVDAQRLLWVYRRPVGYRAQDIGSWYSICRFLNVIAIIVNGLVISYTSNWSKTFLNDNSTNRLIFFVVFEHVVFSIWYLITLIIPDVPNVTRSKIRQEQSYVKDIIYESKKPDKAKRKYNDKVNIIESEVNNVNNENNQINQNFITVSSKRPYDNLNFKQNTYSSEIATSNEQLENMPKRKIKSEKQLRIKAAIMPLNNETSKLYNKIESIDELQKKKKEKQIILKSDILSAYED